MGTTKQWFEQAIPNPTSANVRTQLGCHFEEIHEQMEAMAVVRADGTVAEEWVLARAYLKAVADNLKSGAFQISSIDPLEMLDAICDQRVTGTGVAHMLGYDIEGAMCEVNASNFSKFVDGKPIFNDHGKIMKGPDFFKPNLKPFLCPVQEVIFPPLPA